MINTSIFEYNRLSVAETECMVDCQGFPDICLWVLEPRNRRKHTIHSDFGPGMQYATKPRTTFFDLFELAQCIRRRI